MLPISYARHRFPPEVIRHAVWLYLRFTLSYSYCVMNGGGEEVCGSGLRSTDIARGFGPGLP